MSLFSVDGGVVVEFSSSTLALFAGRSGSSEEREFLSLSSNSSSSSSS